MLLLVEDDRTLAGYCTEYLNLKGETVLHAASKRESMLYLDNRINDFEMVLLDLMLPDGDGLDLLRAIRDVSRVPVIITSAISGEADMIAALNQGADDYLVKPFQPNLLLAKINAFRRRNTAPEAWKYVKGNGSIIRVDSNARSAKENGQEVILTSSEFDVLELLVRNRGKLLSKAIIYETIRGKKTLSGERVIDVYISKLRAKLGIQQELKTIWGKGYMLSHENIQESHDHISD